MMGLGAPELLIILAVILLLFGSTKLPKLARSMGHASKEFQAGLQEGGKAQADDDKDDKEKAKADEPVTMTKAELDALLAEREAQARHEPASGS